MKSGSLAPDCLHPQHPQGSPSALFAPTRPPKQAVDLEFPGTARQVLERTVGGACSPFLAMFESLNSFHRLSCGSCCGCGSCYPVATRNETRCHPDTTCLGLPYDCHPSQTRLAVSRQPGLAVPLGAFGNSDMSLPFIFAGQTPDTPWDWHLTPLTPWHHPN